MFAKVNMSGIFVVLLCIAMLDIARISALLPIIHRSTICRHYRFAGACLFMYPFLLPVEQPCDWVACAKKENGRFVKTKKVGQLPDGVPCDDYKFKKVCRGGKCMSGDDYDFDSFLLEEPNEDTNTCHDKNDLATRS